MATASLPTKPTVQETSSTAVERIISFCPRNESIEYIPWKKMKFEQSTPMGKTHSATVIIFHGSGDNGTNMKDWIRFLLGVDLSYSHIKIIYPTAPYQAYTPLNGEKSHVWFDRKTVSIEARESRKTLSAIYKTVNELINEEIANGIPAERIIVGGFSMGGALAMHTGFHVNRNISGVFTCSSFLNNNSIVYESLKYRDMDKELPELLMFHGDRDRVAQMEWGQTTFEQLCNIGVMGKFVQLQDADHELTIKELLEVRSWITEKLPPLEKDIFTKL